MHSRQDCAHLQLGITDGANQGDCGIPHGADYGSAQCDD